VRSLASKCRVLTAIELLRDSGRTIEHVAHLLRFASSAHLHNTIRRYAGTVPREAAARDVAFWCRRLFIDAAQPGPSASREKEPAPGGMAPGA
jgi:AraC-like DNA-binding protein